jgi:hypothetical protein
MNRNSSGSLTLNKATTGFLNFKTAEGLAQRTLYSYERILVKWNVWFDCAQMLSECALISCEARLSQVAQSGALLRVHSLDSARKGWGPHLLCVALQEVRDFRAITVTHLA